MWPWRSPSACDGGALNKLAPHLPSARPHMHAYELPSKPLPCLARNGAGHPRPTDARLTTGVSLSLFTSFIPPFFHSFLRATPQVRLAAINSLVLDSAVRAFVRNEFYEQARARAAHCTKAAGTASLRPRVALARALLRRTAIRATGPGHREGLPACRPARARPSPVPTNPSVPPRDPAPLPR